MYEGGGTSSVHKTKEGALKAAYETALETSIRMTEYANSPDGFGNAEDWKLEEVENGYNVASDEYVVYEMEILE
jgi:hypothetical protein